jgi:hypothetical protein
MVNLHVKTKETQQKCLLSPSLLLRGEINFLGAFGMELGQNGRPKYACMYSQSLMDGTSCKCTYHEMFVSNDVLFSRLDRKKDRDGQLGSEERPFPPFG